jgi:hypothetical protein
MTHPFLSDVTSWPALVLALFAGMVLLLEVGRRVGRQRALKDSEGARAGLGAVEGAIFGLMGLLVAFTFSGAAARFETRRELIVREANAIGTAWLRLDLLPAEAQTALRARFRDYLDARIEIVRRLPDVRAAWDAHQTSLALQGEIWNRALGACRETGGQPATMLLLPALNEMFDLTTTRAVAARAHTPAIIFGMLIALALVSSLLAGFGMAGGRRRSWIHILGFAGVMAVTVFVILDLEHPRLGLIRLDTVDQILVDLRATMK